MSIDLLVVMLFWKAMAAVAQVWAFAANRPTRSSDAMEGSGEFRFTRQQMYHSSYFYAILIEGREQYGGNLCVLDLKTAWLKQCPPALQRLRS